MKVNSIKRDNLIALVGLIFIALLMWSGFQAPERDKNKADLAAVGSFSSLSGTSASYLAEFITPPSSFLANGLEPAVFNLQVKDSLTNQPVPNFRVFAKHLEKKNTGWADCTNTDVNGFSSCSYTATSSGISKLKICEVWPATAGNRLTNPDCRAALAKVQTFGYVLPDKSFTTIETVKNGFLPSDNKAIIKIHFRDSYNQPIKNYNPGSLSAFSFNDETDEYLSLPVNCTVSDNKGDSICELTYDKPSTWWFDLPNIGDYNRFLFTDRKSRGSTHIVWTKSGGDIFESLRVISDPTQIGLLKGLALSEIDIVGSAFSCENLAARVGYAGYRWCFNNNLLYNLKLKLNLRLYVVIDEQYGNTDFCSADNINTLADERLSYKCRNIENTLNYIKAIANYTIDGKLVFDGIIFDEPAYRSHMMPGADGKSIFSMSHPSRLIHRIFTETRQLNPNFQIMMAENSTGFIDEIMKPGTDGVVEKYDNLSGYWYYSQKPETVKSLAAKYGSGSGMWVSGNDWNPNAADTLGKYGMNTVFFLFGTGSGLQVPFATLRDQILPSLPR